MPGDARARAGTGALFMCLGQEDAADLRSVLRAYEANDLLYAAIDEAISRKPKATTSSSTDAIGARRSPAT